MKTAIAIILCLAIALAFVPGCQTITDANGNTTQTLDPVAARTALELSLVAAREAVEIWRSIQADKQAISDQEYQKELERRQQVVSAIEREIQRLSVGGATK